MSSPVHYQVEVLYSATIGPACGFNARGKLTEDWREVTCAKCCDLLGIEATADEQLTEVQPDPFKGRLAA